MKLKHKAIFYKGSNGAEPAKEYLMGLAQKPKEKMYKRIALLEEKGTMMPLKYCKNLKGHNGIWEIKVQFSTNQYRILFFYSGRTIILLHGFTKKTYETPISDIKTAKKYMKDFKER